MLNSILRACIQQAVHAGSLYVTTTISVVCALVVHGMYKRNDPWLNTSLFDRL